MRPWPASTPDYRWPSSDTSPLGLPIRLPFAILFHVAHAIGRLLRRFRPQPGQICVIRTDGIGDALLFEPALRSLANRFPDKSIHLWAPAAVCELFAAYPVVSRRAAILRGAKAGNLTYFRSLRWRAKLGYRLGRSTFDLAIYPARSPEPMGNWLLASLSAREKWVTFGDTENQFDWQRERTAGAATRVLQPPNTGGHELDYNVHLASQWNEDISGDWPLVQVSDGSKERAATLVRQWWATASESNATQLVGVMPVSSMAVKGYAAESWRQVIADLWRRHRAMCVLLGGPSDKKALNELVQLLGDVPHVRLPAGTDLLTVAAVLPRLDALLSVDTGLAHLAIAQDVPNVVLRTGGHPGRFFPWPVATRSVVLGKPMPCEGCRCRCVLREAECVTRISPGEIVGAYLRLTHQVPSTVAA